MAGVTIRHPMGTSYRPPSREPKGRWARHIHAVRRARGWSQTAGFEAVREGMGLSPKSRAAYIAVDMGERQPTPKEEAALIAVYGLPPEASEMPLEATESGDALVEAIRAQTKAMLALVAAIEGERAERVAWETGVVASIREVALALARRDGPAHEPHADVLP